MEDKRNYCVYKHTNKINGKVYIGITCQKPEYRWNSGRGYKNCVAFNRAIQKYGWDGFDHEILFNNLSTKDAENKEIMLIKQHDSMNSDKGYNIAHGGQAPMYGRNLSKEHKNKIGDSQRGEKNYWYGKHMPDEIRRKMSQNYTYHKPWNKGLNNPYTNEQIETMRNNSKGNHSRAIKTFCDDVIYISIKSCALYHAEKLQNMNRWLNGSRKMPQKYIDLGLRYATEEDLEKYPIYELEETA